MLEKRCRLAERAILLHRKRGDTASAVVCHEHRLACGIDIQPGPGNNVTLAIRPEDVVVRNVQPAMPNCLRVRVADIEFLGAFCRVDLAVEGDSGKPALVADFSINVVRDLSITEGMDLLIALPPERIRVFPGAPKLP